MSSTSAISSISSLFKLETYFEEGSERYYAAHDALENIGNIFNETVKEPIDRYYAKVPNYALSLIISFFASFMIGFIFSSPEYSNTEPTLAQVGNELATCFSGGMESAMFAAALVLVNAAVRPIFDDYFPKNWHFLKLIAEVTVVITLVSVPAYFLCASSPQSLNKLVQLIFFSVIYRLFSSYNMNSEASGSVFEGATRDYQENTSIWTSFYFGGPFLSI